MLFTIAFFVVDSALKHARHAAQLQAAGQNSQAIVEYTESLRLNPKQPDVLTNLGAAYAATGDLLKAVDSYERALKLAPKYDPALLNLGLAYYKMSRWDKAADVLTRYRTGHAGDLRTGILLSDCELQLGNYKQAIAIAEPLEAANSDDLALAYVLGTSYLRDKQQDKGMPLVRKIMDGGDTPQVHIMLGDAYTIGGEYKAAAAEYQKAIDADPKQWIAYLRLAEAQVSQGDFDHALINFKVAADHDPSNFEANYYLGYIYKDHNEPEEAKPYLERAAALRPDLYHGRFEYAVVLMDTGELARSRALLEKLVNQFPKETEAHVVLGRLYLRLRLNEQARQQMAVVQQQNAAKDASAEHGSTPPAPYPPSQ